MTDVDIHDEMPPELAEWIRHYDAGDVDWAWEPELAEMALEYALNGVCMRLGEWPVDPVDDDDDCQPCWIAWSPGITLDDVKDAFASVSIKLAEAHTYLLHEHAVYFF